MSNGVAPVGSGTAVSLPAIRFDCTWLPCVRVFFEWSQPDGSHITSVVPPPTDDERDAIGLALFSEFSTIPSPLRLPEQIEAQPCIPPCRCRRVRQGNFGPRIAVPMSIVVTVPTPSGGTKTFTVTLGIPAKVAVGIGQCRRARLT